MKKMLFFSLLVMFVSIKSFTQKWHTATDTLKLPVYSSHGQSTMEFYNRLDTVECAFKFFSNSNVFRGYKVVYVQNGYYTDTDATINVFFDEKKRRIFNVSEYFLN